MSILSKARTGIKKVRMLPKAWEQSSAGTVRRRIIQPFQKRIRRLLIKASGVRLRLADGLLGAEAGNWIFWRSRPMREWRVVDNRLTHLHENHPHAIAHFTKLSFANAKNPEVLINLARSSLTKDAMLECLKSETLGEDSTVRQRMISSQMTCAGFVAAATILLNEKESLAFARKAADFCPPFSPHFRRMIDSCGTKIASRIRKDARRFLPHTGFNKPKKHRLVLARSIKDIPTLPLLFQGAEAATVYVMDDLYGRADFSGLLRHSGECHVNVEHCRSRITRFSREYHRVYEDTRAAAETLMTSFANQCEDEFVLDDPNGTAMALADNLFFPCLQFVGLERLVASEEFDHIVVAIGGSRNVSSKLNKQFIRLMSGVKGLRTDPRVEMVCQSPHSEALDSLDTLIKLLSTAPTITSVLQEPKQPLAPAIQALKNNSTSLAKNFEDWPASEHPRVMFATSQVAAYNKSSAIYAQSIADISNLRIAFLGGNLLTFTDNSDERISSDMVTPLPQRPHKNLDQFHKWLVEFLAGQIGAISPAYVAHVMSGSLAVVARDGILSHLAHANLCDAWFARLKKAEQLPQAMILTPFRSVRVAAFAQIARNYEVPSIAIEPHGLNSSYCRYCKVTADYYAVISNFFVEAAVEGFGMTAERCPVIGSPRLQGPKDYDVDVATKLARVKIKADTDVDLDQGVPILSYFTQPSDWKQISEVWRIILKATDGLQCQLILKTHPEETASRVNAYLAIAAELGALDRVRTVKTDAVTLIEASDLVLSGYSATVVEAALYRRPVFCVTNGKVDYPLNQHDVIGGPLFRTMTALRREVKAFLKDSAPYQDTAARFLQREAQLVDGFEDRLNDLIKRTVSMPVEEAMRPLDELPDSLFLDGPHKVYKI